MFRKKTNYTNFLKVNTIMKVMIDSLNLIHFGLILYYSFGEAIKSDGCKNIPVALGLAPFIMNGNHCNLQPDWGSISSINTLIEPIPNMMTGRPQRDVRIQ